ncbi:UbiA family prenyltransferase [Demequina sp.]|uniref:UbiA family prenyltransferase n=1 Tax=Demequina sp. TaxID=2050685 RepID=UPI0025C33BEB|nr:UbiA family prenyltransferase [Demequina sp.]
MPSLRVIRALALSCHLLPTAAVTAVSAALAALAGLPIGQGALVVATVFTGQLSIGWSNDYLDADRDRAVQRPDKPIVTGAVQRRSVGIAAGVALLTTSALSVALGWPGGAVALATVLAAWTYNLRLKATPWSWLPYAVAFGLAPAIVTLSASPAHWPAVWVLAAFALLGVAAHLANVLPDLSDDIAHGIRGLPHRIGARPTALITAAILLAASAVILFGPPGQLGPWSWAGFVAALLVAGAATGFAYRDPSSRRFFLAIILIAAIDLVSFGLSGIRL